MSDWDGRQVRRVLKHWYELDHHFNRLTFNDLKYTEQLYFRLSYLTSREQQLLAKLFYHPRRRQFNLVDVARHHRWDYLKLDYAVHKLERKLMVTRSAPNQSLTVVQNLQMRRLADAFHGLFKILRPKLAKYPQLIYLNSLSDEDFGTCRRWSVSRVRRSLRLWYRYDHRVHHYRRRSVADARQLLCRLTYLPTVSYRILRQYYYYPTGRQRRRVRSEHLVHRDQITLSTLLITRRRSLQALQKPKEFPKIRVSSDEKWQLDSDRQDVRAICRANLVH